MPHMTQAYPFEWKVFQFALDLSVLLARDNRTFLMRLGDDGAVRTLQFERPEQSWHDLTRRLTEADESHLFYDPFDAPEYTWLSWHKIERSTMEHLIGHHFEDSDFSKQTMGAHRAPDLKPANTFPVSWGVMF